MIRKCLAGGWLKPPFFNGAPTRCLVPSWRKHLLHRVEQRLQSSGLNLAEVIHKPDLVDGADLVEQDKPLLACVCD